MLDRECGDNPSLIDEAINDLLELTYTHRELSTYLILFGNKFANISDIRRRYIVSSIEYDKFSSRFSHREIIFNIIATKDYLDKEFTYLDPIDDVGQIWNISTSIRHFNNDMESYMDELTNFNNIEESKRMYDSIACLMLECNEPEIRDIIMDNVNEIIERVITSFQCTKVPQGSINALISSRLEPMKEHVEMFIDDAVERILKELGLNYANISDHTKILLFEGVRYIYGYAWMNLFKLSVEELSKTFDSVDYVEFIHTMYQISRYNYNNESSGDMYE